ncbi:hypothetical protein [Alicyclobacillus mengziensis]|uniref:Uncharacterized protein n=1 Tax=Alicyclobacillus mengziensis TaxID=2931921 RepID=A0A9X7W0G0_9BACL|nr:hypothetical protein [Alicyclobacillus mengziensis]QSO48426.1 hypothetical protein JZ786_05410 [Alicyclobacillus mengziensis]
MLRSRKVTSSLLVVLVVALFAGTWMYHKVHSKPANYVLANDNFDQPTLKQIWADIDKWNVRYEAQDHEVYVVTGGLNMANPVIMYANSNGNFTFGQQPTTLPQYQFVEWGQSPANWSYSKAINGGYDITTAPNNHPSPENRVPWTPHQTDAGQTFYEWDMSGDTAYYYFKQGNTYITIYARSEQGTNHPAFPSGIFTHLTALNNPVH